MTDPEEIRSMVLAVVASAARRCMEVVDSAGLTIGQIEDTVEAGDVSWNIAVTYRKDLDMLLVSGKPQVEPIGNWVQAIFAQDDEDDQAFAYVVPAAWLPGEEL